MCHRRILTNLVLAAGLFLIFAANGFSQTEATKEATKICPIHNGIWEVKFALGNAFSRRSSGFILQGGYNFTDHLNLHIGFDGDFSDIKTNQDFYSSQNSIIVPENKSSSNSQYSETIFQYRSYPSIKKNFYIYYGGGPTAGFGHSVNTSTSYHPDPSDNSWESRESYSWAIGISGLFGVEWFASNHFGISAEYGGAIKYIYGLNRNKQWSYRNGRSLSRVITKGFNGNLQDVLVGISVYI